jgi:hypothetical protein
MDLPFSREQFFELFARYNDAVWPAQALLFAIAVACVTIVRAGRRTQPVVGLALAGLLAWAGGVYHIAFFSRINPAALAFGGLTLLGAAVIAWHTVRGRLRFDGGTDRTSRIIGNSLIAYALALYPIIGMFAGQLYPRLPTFGAPCPTTIFVLGMLLLARRPVPTTAFVVPVLWSAIATTAAVELGVVEDLALPLAAIASVVVLASNWQARRRGTPRIA